MPCNFIFSIQLIIDYTIFLIRYYLLCANKYKKWTSNRSSFKKKLNNRIKSSFFCSIHSFLYTSIQNIFCFIHSSVLLSLKKSTNHNHSHEIIMGNHSLHNNNTFTFVGLCFQIYGSAQNFYTYYMMKLLLRHKIFPSASSWEQSTSLLTWVYLWKFHVSIRNFHGFWLDEIAFIIQSLYR